MDNEGNDKSEVESRSLKLWRWQELRKRGQHLIPPLTEEIKMGPEGKKELEAKLSEVKKSIEKNEQLAGQTPPMEAAAAEPEKTQPIPKKRIGPWAGKKMPDWVRAKISAGRRAGNAKRARPPADAETPGQTFNSYRVRQGLTYRELSRKSGIPIGTLFGLVNGQRSIKAHQAHALGQALGVAADAIMRPFYVHPSPTAKKDKQREKFLANLKKPRAAPKPRKPQARLATSRAVRGITRFRRNSEASLMRLLAVLKECMIAQRIHRILLTTRKSGRVDMKITNDGREA